MNTPRTTPTRQLLILRHNLVLRFTTTILLAALGWLPFRSQPVRATQLVLQMDIHQSGSAAGGNLGFYAFAFLNTTNTPITYHEVYSWNTNYQFVGGVGPGSTTYGLGFGSLGDMLNAFTNGPWKLVMNVGDPSQQTYSFWMSAPNFTSNTFPAVHVLSPTNGAVNVTNNPAFTWVGTNSDSYGEVDVNVSGSYQSYYNSDTLPPTSTNWNPGQTLNQGTFSFDASYFNSNAPTVLIITTPTNSLGQTPPGWVTTNRLFADDSAQFTVGVADPSGTSHTLVAHYPWDGTNNDGTASGADTSGNGYDMSYSGSFGSQGGVNWTNDAAAGPGAIQFYDGDGNSGGYVGWTNPTPPGLLSALAGSFSVACWIKTTQSNFGWNQAPAFYGAGIVSADNGGQANDVVPIALTGGTIGFNTGGDSDDTVNSATSVNDGNYHHVVVTRNQLTGQKIIYIDGVLDSFSSGTTNLLNDPQKLTIGSLADASNPDPNDGSYYNGYDGEVDDLQVYSGVLSSNEVAQLYSNPGSTIGQAISVPLVARYNFEVTNNAGIDSSGNGNDANCGTGDGGTNLDTFSTDAAVGLYARLFKGDTGICFNPGSTTFNNLSNALYGSFSWSAWIKTTNSVNTDYANAYFGAPILFDYNSSENSAIFSITGTKAAFTVGNPGGTDTTLHSTTSVTDGIYHLLAVTRNQDSGVMKVYVDGNLEATDVSTNGPVIATAYMYLAGGYYGFFNGLVDDVRIYGGELSAADVASLYGRAYDDFNSALGTTNLTWTTSGDSAWFVETTTTHDGVSAAQSGSVTGNQTSTLSVTVNGPGTLTFYWSSIANDPNEGFDYEFDIDGSYANDIYGDQSWTQDGPYSISSGTHTLSWTVYAYGDTDPTQAGFLDQVSYVAETAPVITLNPFDQTNYPGYSVALLAAATSNAAITWEWFKVGNGSPIPNATNALFIPTNAGTAGVAGSYYAVASNAAGVSSTTAAIVSFVNAPLPPDWSRAFKSPSFNNNTLTEEYYLAALPDSAGDLYAAGSFTGTNTIGAQTFISANAAYETELVKQTATGTLIWALAMTNNGNGNSNPEAVAPAPGDGIYVLGNFSGTNWFGTNKLVDVGGTSVYLARFDANGNTLWVRTITSTNYIFTGFNCVAADPAGNVTISALISGFTTFSSTNSATSTNLFADGQIGALARYDANGKLLWAEMPGAWVLDMAYSAGRLYGSMFAPSGGFAGITNATDRRFSLAAINPINGQAIWLRGVGAPQNEGNPLGIILDAPLISVFGTNVTIVGIAYGSSATFGPYTVSWNADNGQYFARYDTNGTPQLATSFGSETTQPYAALPDASGNIYVGGDFATYSFFGNDILAAPHQDSIGNGYLSHAFLAKFDRNGNALWARPAVSAYNWVNFRSLAVVADGVWACSTLKSPTAFGTNTVPSSITCIGSPFCTLTYHNSGAFGKITVNAATAEPVTLLNPQNNQANFQFSFLSQSGFTHAVEYKTNLVTGSNWQTYSNVAGDGTLKIIPIPLSVFSPARQGFVRVSTQ